MNEPTTEHTWAIVELLGHVKIAGRCSEVERFGSKLGRIDIPQKDGSFVTQYFSGSSLYRLTPCEEAIAQAVASRNSGEPDYAWQIKHLLPEPKGPSVSGLDIDEV